MLKMGFKALLGQANAEIDTISIEKQNVMWGLKISYLLTYVRRKKSSMRVGYRVICTFHVAFLNS